MRLTILLLFILGSCTNSKTEKKHEFPPLPVSLDEEWSTYEGKWLTEDGIIRFELSLKSGAVGYPALYKLSESFESDSQASGTTNHGYYSTFQGFQGNELGIRLHELSTYNKGAYLRYKTSGIDHEDEMFFLTRGSDELLPCDNTFTPLTTDERFTLHKRSSLFTVEGYFTLAVDSMIFFERNTREYWKVANLGEYDDLIIAYSKLATEPHEGIYLKALAYSIADKEAPAEKKKLVIKRIIGIGNESN